MAILISMDEPRSAEERRVRVFDAVTTALAVLAIAVGFYQWHRYGAPSWQPVSVLALLSVPVLVRHSIVVSTDSYANILGLPAAVLFSSGFATPSHVFPVWALLVAAGYVAFKGGLVRGLNRASDDIVAGFCLVTVARYIDLGIRPFDRTAVALAVYVGVLAATFWVRRRLGREGPAVRSLDRRSAALALLALYYISVLIAAMRLTYDDPSSAHTAEVAVLGIGLVVAALIGYTASQQLARGVEVLSEAASSLPWPADDNDALVQRFARRAVRSSGVEIRSDEGGPGTLSAPVDALRHVVLRRDPGDRSFTASDRRLLRAVGSMASVSRTVDLREAGLRLGSITDSLTGLWTYPMFVDLVAEAFLDRRPDETMALLYLDLDRFKAVNEELGHFAADQVLQEVGARLQESAPQNAVTARVAGDEFTVLLRDVDRDQLAYDVQTLVEAVTAPVTVGETQVSVHVSVGVGLSAHPQDTSAEVMRAAEDNMREAKTAGRSTTAAGEEVGIAFQPILDARSGAFWGCEVLARGVGKDRAVDLSQTLVSSAARGRALDALTERVGADALDAMDLLRGQLDRPVTLTINVDFSQFREDNEVLDRFSRAAQERGVPVVLELSERSFRRWTPEHTRLAERLRDRGVALAIDGFGAGYATFSLLNMWRWGLVKIDRSLTSADDEQSRLLLANVIRTLRELRLRTVAVGVETGQQLDAARRSGVAYVQGHLASEAVSMEELIRRVGPDGDALRSVLAAAAEAVRPG